MKVIAILLVGLILDTAVLSIVNTFSNEVIFELSDSIPEEKSEDTDEIEDEKEKCLWQKGNNNSIVQSKLMDYFHFTDHFYTIPLPVITPPPEA